jgi:glycerophosphoryl diester phosphodiesterase
MKNFILIGHRGACYYEPENSLRSFKRALKLKCKYLECDVRLTRDKEVVIMHDNKLDRTTNEKGRIKYFTLNELKKFYLDKKEKIPTLQELIDLAENKASLVIELKDCKGIAEKTLEIIKKNKIEDKVIIASFYSSYLKKVKSINSKIKTALLSFKPFLLIRRAKRCRADLIGIYYKFLKKDFIDNVHKNNLKVFAYESAKENLDSKKIKGLIKFGLDGIVLNKPILH